MHIVTVILIAAGLAMDAFAVAITSGLAMKCFNPGNALKLAASFGAFQACMPMAGWLAGTALRNWISAVDHWVAFVILSAVGGKMIIESFKLKAEDPADSAACRMSVPWLLTVSVATSIDALAVGVSLSFLSVPIITPALVIGMVTFAISFVGVYIGNRVGHFFENKIEVLGGLILIVIGAKILLEHSH
ncbi:MAG TPA: manganese efflux pump MntP family protein [Patescibacteria group bacterium]|nr:manganese efflux pump MntP family protein [Patescibacteria group bacterium]